MSFVRNNYIKNKCFYKRGRKSKKIGIRSFFWCLSTHVWGFFPWVCEWRKTLEGRYLSCLDVKEPKKIISFPWFHQITPKKRARKSKKIGIRRFFYVQVPMFGVFFRGCASAVRHWRGAICHVCTSKNPKKLFLFPGSVK